MSTYTDGFILTIKKENLAAYTKLAKLAGKVWREHGALEYRECVADDMNPPEMIPFPKLARAREGEVVIFAYAVFKSRRHRDAANQKIMADQRLEGMCEAAKGVVNYKRMAYGGFKTIVSL